MKIIEKGSIDSVPGFYAAGTKCGIKMGDAPDLAVLLCETACTAAGIFTTNRVKAAPVIYCRNILSRNNDNVRGIVVNSGNANACTGQRGLDDAALVAGEAEELFSLFGESVLVMSTGVIGVPLPVDKIKKGLRQIRKNYPNSSGESFARAIMTTDLQEKCLAVEIEVEGVPVTLGAAAKGSGMIHPNLATMLAFFTTDAAVSPDALSTILRRIAERTFNMVSVDGDQSTNDSVFVLASGSSGAPLISGPESPGFSAFFEAFLEAATILTRKIAADGEGATKLVEIRVVGADTYNSAVQVARTVANSPLVKTALFGADPNWGRIICAAGYSGVPIEPEKVDIYFGKLPAVKKGVAAGTHRDKLSDELRKKEVVLVIDLHQGDQECCFWTCDFSGDYVRINADYCT